MTNKPLKSYNVVDGDNSIAQLDNGIPQTNLRLTLTVNEMAKQLNISRTTAYNLVNQQDFYPAFHIGNRVLVSSSALSSWLQKQTEGKVT